MLFPTFTFAVFFFIVFLGHLALRSRPIVWRPFLICSSYLFYAWWNPTFCGLIGGSTLFNWVAANSISRSQGRRRRRLVTVAVAGNLAVLGVFKYYDFFVVSTENLTDGIVRLPILELILPVGISFFTFQAVSYVVDVGRKHSPTIGFVDFALYLSFFPQLVAGPIVRVSEFSPGVRQAGDETIPTGRALWLIGRGLFKKVVVASYLSTHVVDTTFGTPSVASREDLLLGFYGYAIQIYADFSGYTDIAIGIALLLGFRFPTNFDRPYSAISIQDFWRRWHMTLSRWLRDYLYIPLGGNRGTPASTHLNLMITMILGGLWHGASWTMAAWGAIHGLVLVTERSFGDRLERIPDWIRWLATFHVVSIAWVLFRAESFGLATTYLSRLFVAPFSGNPDYLAVLIIVSSLVAQLLPLVLSDALDLAVNRLGPATQGLAAGAWIWLVVSLGPVGISPFIYFQF